MPASTQKALALRAKTDADLLVLINRELDRALGILEAANIRNSRKFAQGEKAMEMAMRWLPTIGGLSQCDSLWIKANAKVNRLRSQLDRLPVSASGELQSVFA